VLIRHGKTLPCTTLERRYRFHASATLPLVPTEYGTSFEHWRSCTKKWWGKKKTAAALWEIKPVPPSSNHAVTTAIHFITSSISNYPFKKKPPASTVRPSSTSLPKLTPPAPPPKKIVLWSMNIYHGQNNSYVFGFYSNEFRSTKRSPSMTFPTKNIDPLLAYYTHVTCPTALTL